MAAGVGELTAGAMVAAGAALQPLVQPVVVMLVPQVLQAGAGAAQAPQAGAGAAQVLQGAGAAQQRVFGCLQQRVFGCLQQRASADEATENRTAAAANIQKARLILISFTKYGCPTVRAPTFDVPLPLAVV